MIGRQIMYIAPFEGKIFVAQFMGDFSEKFEESSPQPRTSIIQISHTISLKMSLKHKINFSHPNPVKKLLAKSKLWLICLPAKGYIPRHFEKFQNLYPT
jgi:hypothetical protein